VLPAGAGMMLGELCIGLVRLGVSIRNGKIVKRDDNAPPTLAL
jgi:hypothetical protein